MKTKTKPKKFWAMLLKYNPFVMGGDVWQPVRYETDGSPVKVKKYSCFVFFNELQGEYQVHDKKSGGLIGHGRTKGAALALARENVETTPDLDEQMAKISLMSCKVVEREWALRVGSKGR